MKGKIFSVLFALVLVLSLSMVMAAPASANVSKPTVAVDSPLASVVAEYTIGFDINTSLGTGGTITVVFPAGTTVPATYVAGDITVQGANVSASGSSQTVTIVLANAISAPATVTVVFTTAADIVNPTAGAKTLTVATSAETSAVTSNTYTILALPTVTGVAPIKGNVGDTMWVEITGTTFTGTAATNASTTTLNFGGGITVVSTKYVSATSIDCQITITAPGAVSVAATTAAGTGTTTFTFTANDAGTPQVDVWDAYDLTADPFVAGTLVFQETTTTIQAAEDACAATETVIVHADTYEENVVIDKSITLQSMTGPATTIIDASDETAEAVRGAVQILTNTVTLGGDGVGFTIIAPDASVTYPDQYGVELFVDASTAGVTIEGNTIRGSTNTGSSSPQVGIHLWGTGPYTTLTIKDNTLTTTFVTDTTIAGGTSAGIITGANVTSLQGTFDGNTITGYSLGVNLATLDAATTAIFGNTVSNSAYNGICVSGTAAIDVYSNTISGCGANGLGIAGSQTDIDVYENVIYGNGNGVKVYSGTDASTVTLEYNDIYSNTNTSAVIGETYGPTTAYENYGVLNAGSDAMGAKYNWWGDISGPDSSGVITEWTGTALGTGDIVAAVSGSSVVYDPWLTRDQATTITAGIAYYGSIYPLEAGWNTLSVPLALDDGADTLDDIVALGDFFVTSGTDQNYLGGYYYDASLGLWVPLTGAYEFVPCKAVYVKMEAAASFPVLYSGVFGLPSVSLPAGWNLIGSGFGVDKTSGDYGIAAYSDSDGQKVVNQALASLGANASVVVSPSLPGQTLAWGTVATDSSTNMIVGEGYWVFMTASATLAGFEVTPIYWILLP